MPPPHIVVLYNEPVLHPSHPDAESEHEVLYTADVIAGTLEARGFAISRFGVGHDVAALVAELKRVRPDAVFNLYEGAAGEGGNEAYVAGLLEWLGISFTGSPSCALAVARQKHLTKHLLRGARIPTPEFMVVHALPVPDAVEQGLEFPVIVKPALQDASVGIDQGSVVTDQGQLDARVRDIMGRYGSPVLVERFIRGREFNLSVVELSAWHAEDGPSKVLTLRSVSDEGELRLLPVGEIQFKDKEPGFWPIVTYDAKWRPGTRDFVHTPVRFPEDLSPRVLSQLETIAFRSFRLLGCRDYARIDVRVSSGHKAYVLEVNPNPCISPLAGVACSLEKAGRAHADFVVDLVRGALRRNFARQASVSQTN